MNKLFSFALLLFFTCFYSSILAQNTISGNVVDETGQALIGATILIEGTNSGTVSDLDGNFSLTNEQAYPWNLVISYTGYEPLTKTVVEDGNLEIVLSNASIELSNVLVTASRRVENIQEVPVSVSALSAKQLNTLDVQDLNDITMFIPGVEYSDNPIVNNIFVRGLGSGVTLNIEQSAGRFVDNIYISRAIVNTHMVFDLGNVEILRGPQGTLFGKNTLAGAIIQRTQAPTYSFQAGIGTKLGVYSTRGSNQEFEGFISGSLSKRLRARAAFKIRNNTGWIENSAPDGFNGEERFDYGVRLRLDYDISDKTIARFKVEQNHWDANGTNTEITDFVEGGAGNALRAGYESFVPNFEATANWKQHVQKTPFSSGLPADNWAQNDQDYQTVSLDIEHKFNDGGIFNSITGYQHYKLANTFNPIDAGIMPVFQATRFEQFDGFQQEFRYASAADEDKKIDYILGAYFDFNDLRRQQPDYIDFKNLPFPFGAPPLEMQRRNPFNQTLISLSGYGQLRWKVADKFRMILGARYGWEEKEFEVSREYTTLDGSSVIEFEAPHPVANALGSTMNRGARKRAESNFSPSITAQYIASTGNMIYATFAQGFKGGGFSDRISNDALNPDGSFVDEGIYDAEEANSFEIGFKNTFLDNKLTTNVVLFRMDIDGLQVAGTIPGTVLFNVYNAAEVTSQGIEMDFMSNLGKGWSLGANYAYLDATYKNFPITSAYANQPADEVFYAADDVEQANALQSLTGKTLAYSPKHKVNVYLNKTATLKNGWKLNGLFSATISSGYFTEYALDPMNYQENYSTLQAGINFTTANDKVTFGVLAKNLTNTKVAGFALDTPAFPSYYQILNPPREISLSVNYRF